MSGSHFAGLSRLSFVVANRLFGNFPTTRAIHSLSKNGTGNLLVPQPIKIDNWVWDR